MALDISGVPELAGPGVRERREDVEEFDAFDDALTSDEGNFGGIARDGLLLHQYVVLDAWSDWVSILLPAAV